MRLSIGFLLIAGAALAQSGSQMFAARCGVCHGADGHGSERGPNLANARRVRALSIDELRNVILNGIPASGMPAFHLAPADLDKVTLFVRSLSASASGANAPGDRAAGERYFFGNGGCAQCHMVLGRGKAVGPDLSSVGREMTLAEIEEAVRTPSAKITPGYEVVNVKLHDGRSLRGFARNRNIYNLQLQDLAGRFVLLDQTEIAELTTEPRSLMPEPQCAPADCRDMLAYLSSLNGVTEEKKAAPLESAGGLSFDQIVQPKPGDWPTYHGHLTGNRHSPLDQINPSNIRDLALQWVFPVNHFALEVTPVVVDGVMYVTGPNQVFAIDGRSGRTIWHYQRQRSHDVTGDPAKGTNRGVAVLGDRIFIATDNSHLIALHRVTGQLLWDSKMTEGPQNNNYGTTSAPLVVKDLVISGVAGGDQGVRGFLSAYKASTGERAWRFWTTPKPGEPGSETWKGTALARYGGGGATWMTGTYDAETGTLFWGVGNPYPALNGDERQGDNLYTAAVLALNPDTGALKWYYQFTPHDLHDWDAGQTPMVVNATFRGQPRKLLIQANRNGFFYVFDRTNGQLLLGEKFVDRLNWASGIGKDGRPILLPGQAPESTGTKGCPSILGATNWMSMAYNSSTGLFYLMALEACMVYKKPPAVLNAPAIPIEPGQKFLRALDIETGKRVWEVPQIGTADSWGGVLSTAGGVVFFGEDSGAFAAVDAKTGHPLWHIQTNASAELGDGHSWRASPMTYMAGGKQYVAVAAGPNILCFGLPYP
ncbi:MAG TPA: PQQ-binding-like beta-propeller repeat protein [Bryobacteraceae bacterium]|nr:PQQ-binding-like beta-propeller repeat protein [Bryobacteraceae bacterium]